MSAVQPPFPGAATLDAAVRAIRAGESFVVVTGESRPEQTDLLHAAIAALGPGFHFLRLGNPLSSPLTLGRVLIQLGSCDQDAADGDELRAVLHALEARRSSEDQVVVAVEDAGTLEPEALLFLGRLPEAPAIGLPRLQLLLVGGPGLLALVEQQQLHGSSERIGTHLVIGASAPEEAACEGPRFDAAADGTERTGDDLRRTDAPPASPLRNATASTTGFGQPARPAPSTVEAEAESRLLGDDATSGDLEQASTARSGRGMAGILIVLALLLGAVLAVFLSKGNLSPWILPWER